MGEWRRSELGHGVTSSEFGLDAQLRVVSWHKLGVLEGKVKKNLREEGIDGHVALRFKKF